MSAATLLPRYSNPDRYQAAIEKTSFNGQWSRSSVIVTLAIALGLYNSLEMTLLILTTFKKWKGLYFWSLKLCNLGVMLYSLGMMLMYYDLCILWLSKVILDIGWLLMIVCQSFVLYSRLNLILENLTLLKAIKWYVIIDSFILATTTIVLDFGTTYVKGGFVPGYFYVEHIQVTGFTLQEVLISGVYVWKTIRLLEIILKANTRHMIWQLLIINVVIIAMDIALISLQFKHLQLYQESIKGFVYSVKLKLELNILSKLVDLVHGPRVDDRSMTLATLDSGTIVGQAKSDIQQEISGQDFVTTWVASDQKSQTIVRQSEGSQSSRDSDSLRPPITTFVSHPSEQDGITRIRSHRSGTSSRLNGRESDTMYADMLRSISK